MSVIKMGCITMREYIVAASVSVAALSVSKMISQNKYPNMKYVIMKNTALRY